MKKQILSEEFRRMQKLAGIINENTNTLEQDIVDFWGLLQDDAAQSDGEYEAEWDTDFFIEQYKQYKGKEVEIEKIVNQLKQQGKFSNTQSVPKTSKFKGIKGKGSILNFVEQNLDSIMDEIANITGDKIYYKELSKRIKSNPALMSGDENLVQFKDQDEDEEKELYDTFQIAFNRNKITDGGFKSKIVVDGTTLFGTF